MYGPASTDAAPKRASPLVLGLAWHHRPRDGQPPGPDNPVSKTLEGLLVDPKTAANGDATSELAQELLQLRQQLIEADLPSDEVKGIVEAFAARPRVEMVKPLELWTDEELEDEAERRKISWLSLESDQDLLDEMERRRLTSTKSDLSEEEFEREAERRGYRNSLAQYSIDEIKSYLAVQGHGKQGGGGGNYQGGGRRKKNRSKRRGGGGGNHM